MKSSVKKWSDARYKAFITTTLRAGFRRFPNKFEALKSAFVGKKKNPETGRICSFYRCSKCRKHFTVKNVQVDHIKPVVPESGFSSWDEFIQNLFCDVKNLKVLCKDCHSKKTEQERRLRNEYHKIPQKDN